MSAGLWFAATADGPPDAVLLARYASHRDEAAFAALVARHGRVVYAVCRRLLGRGPDAEDAFQVTFLVLAKRAGNVRDPAALAGWLHGVARRTALQVRGRRAVRWKRETLTDVPEVAVKETFDDLPAVLDDELARLPDKYRSAILLCDLGGRSRESAARQLGVPEGTLSSRLAEGRKRLAAGLAKRGLSPAAVAGPAVPVGLLAAASAGKAADSVHQLATEVIRAMTISKLKVWGLSAAAALAVGVGLAHATRGGTPAQSPAVVKEVAALVAAAGPTVADAPPVVVKTVPQAGAADVDTTTTEIKVTFSKEMTDQSWSWATAGDYGAEPTMPDGAKIAYDKDKKTCVMPVKLEAGKTYAIWVNSQRFGNFKDADGRAAVPYLLVFQTKK